MRAAEIRALAVQAGIGPGVSVLDLCCGVAGPGRFVTAELGCTYLGVDASAAAIEIARERAGDLPCRFEVSQVAAVARRPVRRRAAAGDDAGLPDKEPLLREVAGALDAAAGSRSRWRRARR